MNQDISSQIAIVGIDTSFPGSMDSFSFWKDLLQGQIIKSDLFLEHSHPDQKINSQVAYEKKQYVPLIDQVFNSAKPIQQIFGPESVDLSKDIQVLALNMVEQVLEDCLGSKSKTFDRSKVSLILGFTSAYELFEHVVSKLQRPIWESSLKRAGISAEQIEKACELMASNYSSWQENPIPELIGNVLIGQIAERYKIKDARCVIDAAQASSLAAIFSAVQELRSGSSDLVICGGVDTMNEILQMCSPGKNLGTSRGEDNHVARGLNGNSLGGLGMFVLKRLADAEEDEDTIYAVIKGLGSAKQIGRDGDDESSFHEQVNIFKKAHEQAGYGPSSVGLAEFHGTRIFAGDQEEIRALLQYYPESAMQMAKPYCAIGSVKSLLESSSASSGAAGLFKIIMSLYNRVLPASEYFRNTKISLHDTGFFTNQESRPWLLKNLQQKRCASLSFLGPTVDNFYLTLEEYTNSEKGKKNLLRSWPYELFVWGASSSDMLLEELEAFQSDLKQMQGNGFAWLSYESQQAFDSRNEYRLAIVAKDLDELARKIEDVINSLRSESLEHCSIEGLRLGVGRQDNKIGFLFSGEGSQYTEMGRELAIYLPRLFDNWQKNLGYLPEVYSEQLIDKIFPKVSAFEQQAAKLNDDLADAKWAQAAIAGLSLAMLELLKSLGISAYAAGGHSFGELLALYSGGALCAEDVMNIAHERGNLMSEAAGQEPGAMLAVFAPELVIKACLESLVLQGCYFAIYNAPKWQVMAGSKETLVVLEQELQRKGIACTFLPVGTGFHSPMLAHKVSRFEEFLNTISFSPLKLKVYSGRFASPYPKDPVEIPTLLASQLAHPIRFQSMIEIMSEEGCNLFLEIGPRQSLTKLVNDILVGKQFTACAMDNTPSESGLTKFLDLIGLLLSKGVKINTEVLWEGYRIPNKPKDPRNYDLSAAQAKASEKDYYKKPISADSISCEKPEPELSVDQSVVKDKGMPKSDETTQDSFVHTSDFLEAFKEVQKQTADAHEAFQKSMAEAHLAYLKSAEESFKGLANLMQKHEYQESQDPILAKMGGSADSSELEFNMSPEAELSEADVKSDDTPLRQGAEQILEDEENTADFLIQEDMLISEASSEQDEVLPIIEGASKNDAKTVVEVETKQDDSIKIELYKEIAQKTGYPLAMLDSTLDLQKDLGIDSAKKVQILTSLSEKFTRKQGMSAEKMEQVKSLGDIMNLWCDANDIGQKSKDVDLADFDSEKKKSQSPHFKASFLDSDSIPIGIPEDKPVNLTVGSGTNLLFKHILCMKPTIPSGLAQPGLWWPKNKYKVFVSDSGSSLSWIFCDLLKSKGINAVLGKKIPHDARAVIFLGGLRPATNLDEALAVNEECFTYAKEAMEIYGGKLGAFITVQDTGGHFGFEAHDPIRCYLSGLPGISKTLKLVQTSWSLKSIDINQGMSSYQEIAKSLFNELAFGGDQLEVGLHPKKERASLGVDSLATKQGKSLLKDDDLVLAILGSCGITSKAISSFIKGFKIKLVLIGRSKLRADPSWAVGLKELQPLKEAVMNHAVSNGRKIAPLEASRLAKEVMEAREVRENISRWQEQGHEVHYLCNEGGYPEEIGNHLNQVRKKWGEFQGLIYGGGLDHDSILPHNSLDEFHRVFASKVKVLINFLELTKEDPLKFMSIFTFAESHFQKIGRADHAMANEILNKISLKEARKRGADCCVKAIQWEPWDGDTLKDTGAISSKPISDYQRASWFRNEMTVGEETGSQVILGPARSRSIPAGDLLMNLHIDAQSHPFLNSHMINGKIVVPLVMVIEWFHRLIEPLQESYQFYNLDKVKAHKSIVLENFAKGGDRLLVKASKVEQTEDLMLFESQVCSLEGEVLYTAQIELTKEGLEFPKTLDLSGFTSQDIDAKPGYGEALFHGPDFQVLQAVGRVENEGAQAKGAEKDLSHWGGDQWTTHAAAYDAGLQLALLWSSHVLGGSSLPTEISKVRSFVKEPKKGPFRCVLKRRSVEAGQACSDMYFLDQSNQLFAKFEGVSTFRNEGA